MVSFPLLFTTIIVRKASKPLLSNISTDHSCPFILQRQSSTTTSLPTLRTTSTRSAVPDVLVALVPPTPTSLPRTPSRLVSSSAFSVRLSRRSPVRLRRWVASVVEAEAVVSVDVVVAAVVVATVVEDALAPTLLPSATRDGKCRSATAVRCALLALSHTSQIYHRPTRCSESGRLPQKLSDKSTFFWSDRDALGAHILGYCLL